MNFFSSGDGDVCSFGMYIYVEANHLGTTAYFGKIHTFVTFAFSDMCIEIIILEYKGMEFDYLQNDTEPQN